MWIECHVFVVIEAYVKHFDDLTSIRFVRSASSVYAAHFDKQIYNKTCTEIINKNVVQSIKILDGYE